MIPRDPVALARSLVWDRSSITYMIFFVTGRCNARCELCFYWDNIVAANPEKEMLRLCSHRCPHMHEITLEQTRDSLKYMRYVIDVPEDIRVRALRSVERMLAVGPKID